MSRAIIFDLDGTLLDSAAAICAAAAAALCEFGGTVTPPEIKAHLGAPLEHLYDHFLTRDRAAFADFVARYVELHDAHPEATPTPFPGARETLERLDVPVGLATTKPTHRARAQLVATSLHDHFHHVQGTDAPMRAKPAPDVIEAACRGLGVPPRDVLMVGDTQRDVDAARACGASVVVVAYSDEARRRALGFGADRVLSSLLEL